MPRIALPLIVLVLTIAACGRGPRVSEAAPAATTQAPSDSVGTIAPAKEQSQGPVLHSEQGRALQAELALLGRQRTALQQQYDLSATKALEGKLDAQTSALTQAKETVAAARKDDSALVAARQEEATARQALAEVRQQAVSASPEAKQLADEQAALLAEQRDLRFRQEQVRLILTHGTSPVASGVAQDAAVVAAADALETARAQADAVVLKQAQAVEEAEAAAKAMRDKVEADPQVQAASEAVRVAEVAQRTAREQDPVQVELSQARAAMDAARLQALASDPKGTELQAARTRLVEEQTATNQQLRGFDRLLRDLRTRIAASDSVTAQRQAVEQAEVAAGKAAADLPAGKALATARESYDALFAQVIGPNQDYAAMAKQEASLEAATTQAAAKLLEATTPEALRAAHAALLEAQTAEKAHAMKMREVRVASEELSKAWRVRANAQKVCDQALATTAAGKALATAEKALGQAVDNQLAAHPAVVAVRQDMDRLREQQRDLAFRLAQVDLTLSHRYGPVQAFLETEAAYTAAVAALQATARKVKDAEPGAALKAANDALATARKAETSARAAVAGAAELQAAEQARKERGKVLKEAQQAAAQAAGVATATQALKDARQAAIAVQAPGKEALAQSAAADARLAEIDGRFKALEKARRDLERGEIETAAVTAAKTRLTAAQQALKAAEANEALKALEQAVKDADKALKQHREELLQADETCKALRQQISDLDKQIKVLQQGIKDAEKETTKPEKKAKATPAAAKQNG